MASSIEPPSEPQPLDPNAAREFALIADAAPVPMWTTQANGRRGFVNQAYLAFSGLSYDAALAADWRDALHPDDADSALAETVAGATAGVTFTVEARYRRHDGEWRWLRSVSRPRVDTAGARAGYVGVAHDITEAKVAELALRARERQLSVLIDQTAAGLAQIDLAGRFTLVNDRFCAMVGWSREQLLMRTAREITHPDDLDRSDALFAAIAGDGHALSAEKRYVRRDGGIVWVSNAVAMSRDETGAPDRLIAISLDITARREAESAMQANETRLRFLDALGRETAAASDADVVLAVTTRLLGEHLAVADCAYADVDPDGDVFHIRGDWTAPDVPSIVGTYSLATFGSQAVADLKAGRPLVIEDMTAIEGDGAAAFRAIGIQATICMPFIKGGRLAAMMATHSATPRRWKEAELALVREVTERSWAHVERVRAEAALRDSERQLRLAIDGARIGTWEQDLRTGRGRWSPRSAEIMGVPHDRPLSATQRTELIHPDDRERMAKGTARLALEGSDFAVEHRIVRPDGAVRWVASHGVVMRDEAGAPIRAIGTVRDVTTRREAQEALTRLNQTLEQQVAERTAERDRMWEISPDLMVVIGFDGVFRRVNPAWTTLIGYRPDELIGHHVNEFVVPDDHEATVGAYEFAAKGGQPRIENRYRHKDGSVRWISWTATPAGDVTYATGRDVTGEKERAAELAVAQEQLRQAQKVESLGQLTGGVAHDFNNLLTPIIGNLDLLGRRLRGAGEEDERQARLIGGALESAERARVLVQRLLAFARRQPLQPGAVDLETLVASMTSLVASTAGPRVEVLTTIAPDLPPALADRNQLELAILNLAVNARDAMPDGGRLRIAASVADEPALARVGLSGAFVALSVTDTGTGMDADTAARAVEPFFSTKGVGKGTGLGLSMVHGLASQLGGAMLLDTATGEGTRVALLLPVASDAAPARAAPVETVPARGEGRVLLVDDEAPVREATAAMLSGLGYEVATAASGEEALATLDGQTFLVTDHLMPGMRGADLARAALVASPALKVLVISGYAALDEIPRALPRLAKPFRLDELARAMAALG